MSYFFLLMIVVVKIQASAQRKQYGGDQTKERKDEGGNFSVCSRLSRGLWADCKILWDRLVLILAILNKLDLT